MISSEDQSLAVCVRQAVIGQTACHRSFLVIHAWLYGDIVYWEFHPSLFYTDCFLPDHVFYFAAKESVTAFLKVGEMTVMQYNSPSNVGLHLIRSIICILEKI